jgi:hypothetical protein
MSLVKPALQAHAEMRNKQFQKARGRFYQKYVGASEVGMCIRRIGFAKTRKTLTDSWGAAERGKNFEDHYWLPAMRKRFGKNLLYAGKQQVSLIHGQLRATPDGLLINQPRDILKSLRVDDIGPSRSIVIDCKSIDPRINLAEAKPEHEFQIQIQMALMRITTKHRPDYGVLSYTNASFFDDVVEFAFKYDPGVFEQAKRRAALALNARDPDVLSPEGWIAGGKECEYCPFASECQAMRSAVPQGNKPPSNIDRGVTEKLMALVMEERRLHAMAGELEIEHRKMQYEIKSVLKAHGLNRIESGDIVVVWSPVKGRPSFNFPALKSAAEAAGFNIQQFETVGEPSDRLTVTIKNEAKPRRSRLTPATTETARKT